MYRLADICKSLAFRIVDEYRKGRQPTRRHKKSRGTREEEEAEIRAAGTPRSPAGGREIEFSAIGAKDSATQGDKEKENAPWEPEDADGLAPVDQAIGREEIAWVRDVLANRTDFDEASVETAQAAMGLLSEGVKPTQASIGQRCGGLSKSTICRRIAKIRKKAENLKRT